MSLGFDPIGLIERGYEAASDTSAWVRGMAAPIFAAFNPSADYAYAFCLEPQGRSRVFWLRTLGLDEHALTAELARMHARYTPGMLRALLDSVRASGLLTRARDHGQRAAKRGRARETLDVGSIGRRYAAAQTTARAEVDRNLVMTPGGRVVHAHGAAESRGAREQLRAAVKSVDRARVRRGRSDPHAALELWRGMFFGRCSLVDHFDSDGRRYVLARLNTPGASGSSVLRLRQRQALFFASAGWSNNEIGYALGIAEITVASHLRRALASMGVASRAAWIRLSSQLASAG